MKDLIGNMVGADRVTACVCREGQAVTAEMAAEVVSRLVGYLRSTGKTQAWAATAMGIGGAALAAAVGEAYAAEHEETIRAVDRWLEMELGRQAETKYVRTGVAEKIVAAGRFAVRSGGIVLVTGPAGIGKTLAAKALAEEVPGSIFTTIHAAGITSPAVMEGIAEAMPLRLGWKLTSARMYTTLEKALRDTGRLLIVDEVHRLAARRKDEALHVLRDLGDGAGIPQLWLGMSAIKQYIQAGRSDGEALDQLASRIGLFLDLAEDAQADDGGRRMTSVEDVRRFLAARKIRVTPGAEGYLLALVNELGAGAFRAVDKILQMAVTLARGAVIDEELLRGIQIRRLGMNAATSLESRMAARVGMAVGA